MVPLWLAFVVGAILSWGAYVPFIHEGQVHLGRGPLRAFLCVGAAYFLTAVVVPGLLLALGAEETRFTSKGAFYATVAGVLGAAGALCVIFALKLGGKPVVVAPLVFAGAPIVNALVSMAWHRPATPPKVWFYVGMVLAAVGAALVLRYKPN